jgi:hypothetical protein
MAQSSEHDSSGAGATPLACPRVAVVAVHGIGHHEAGASADAMANLLLGLNSYLDPPGSNPYGSFTSREIQIPLPGAAVFSPRSLSQPPKRPLGVRLRTVLEERRGFFQDKFRWKKWLEHDTQDEVAAADSASEFMFVQLNEYAGDPQKNDYITRRLEGQRSGFSGKKDRDLHIYEMYWSDLARPSNSFLRFFMSFYQLLLHLTSLGRIAVDFASLEHMGKRDWFILGRLYAYATRVFTLGVWILLALLPVVAFSPLPLLLGHENGANSVAAGVVLLAALAAVWKFGGRWWQLLPAAIASVAGVSVLFLFVPDSVSYLLTLEWWGLGVFVFWQVCRQYDQVRPGAKEAGVFFSACGAIGFLVSLGIACRIVPEQAELQLRIAAFWMMQYLVLCVRIFWILFLMLAVFACIAEWVCLFRLRKLQQPLARARAALRTGRFTLALPAVLLLLLTLFLWSGVFRFTAHRIKLYDQVYPAEHSLPGPLRQLVLTPEETDRVLLPPVPTAKCPAPGMPVVAASACADPYRYLQGVLFQSAPPGFPAVLGLMSAGFLLLTLIILASVVWEFQTPISAPNGLSRRLAAWLSNGYDSFRVLIWCFWMAAFAAPSLYVLVAYIFYFYGIGPHPAGASFLESLYSFWGMALTGKFLNAGGAFIAGSAALLFGILVKNGSTALDAILDVDTYLRTSPAHAVPRARIAERYVSLLHYLNAYRGSDGRGYDHIILVAHSLGSNITTDLLRFLHQKKMKELSRFAFAGADTAPVPLIFFSMGSPLRQLLNRFFPHLYRWIREVPEGAGDTCASPTAKQAIPAGASPDPAAQLNVRQWINFFRSGDYVGRSIWLDGWYQRTDGADEGGGYPEPLKISTDAKNPPVRVEACIGLGAHTHYWDRTAPDVAEKLNELI